MNKPFSPPKDRAAKVSGSLPSAGADAARVGTYQPIGHDAPRHSAEWANYRAACIAAREVRGRAIHSEAHRQSLEAWERGERAWPWPDPTPDEQAAADIALRSLLPGLLSDEEMLRLRKGQADFARQMGGR